MPFPAGGPVDVMGRLMAQHLSTSLGQQVIIDNRPGAGSTIAAKALAASDPDGYTLMVGSAATMAIGPTLYPNAGYDPARSFAPIGFVSSVPYVMITRPQAAQKTLRELVAYAKANPGKLNFGIPNGAPPHMLAAWFRNVTATDIVIVPYRGASVVITDLIGGQVDLGFETTSVTFGHIREGKVRALGVATANRLDEIPDVPTMIESGIPDFTASPDRHRCAAGARRGRHRPPQRRDRCRTEARADAGAIQGSSRHRRSGHAGGFRARSSRKRHRNGCRW